MTTTINASNSGSGGLIQTADASGVLALQTAGVTAVTIDASQRTAFVAGTAALPAITTSGDTNTGIFFSAADTIDFAEGGTACGQFDSSANFKFNSGYGSVATAYGCRAWVNFNGTSTVAIRASGNVSSITDNGNGDYTVNFTTAMPDADYSAVGTAGQKGVAWGLILFANTGAFATSGLRLITSAPNDVAGDTAFICVAIFR